VRIPTKIEILILTPPEGEPVRNPRTAGITVNNRMMSTLSFVTKAWKISGIPVATVIFLNKNAP